MMPYQDWFHELDQLLQHYCTLWQVAAFHHRGLPWQHSHPELCEALEQLSGDALDQLEASPSQADQWFPRWLGSDLERLQQLCQLPILSQRTLHPPRHFSAHIPGRKWQQIQAFAACLPAEPRQLLEWCSGKAHLARLLAVCDQRPATGLDIQLALCQQGQTLADRCGADVHLVQADAMAPSSQTLLPVAGHVVALHACGELHTQLMHHWVNSASQRLTIAPCCYHLISHERYQPLSRAAKNSHLSLSKRDLQIPLQETVTASGHVRRQRQTERLWRMAFDEWQRDYNQRDQYLPLPTFQKRLLNSSFSGFVQWACEQKQLPKPPSIDDDYWLSRGQERVLNIQRIEWVSHRFQRALELWLVLDRVLYLCEHRADVRLGLFCDKQITPRNIVLDAVFPP